LIARCGGATASFAPTAHINNAADRSSGLRMTRQSRHFVVSGKGDVLQMDSDRTLTVDPDLVHSMLQTDSNRTLTVDPDLVHSMLQTDSDRTLTVDPDLVHSMRQTDSDRTLTVDPDLVHSMVHSMVRSIWRRMRIEVVSGRPTYRKWMHC
jgi:hypothetical protein